MRQREVEEFLYREARLMDEHRYQDWLSLWSDDGVYWVPCSQEAIDPDREVSIIYDDRAKITDRVDYLETGTTRGRELRPVLRRVISNIETTDVGEDEIDVESNFVLVEARGNTQILWCGRSFHKLRRTDGALKIAAKKVVLVNSEHTMPILQFLI